MLVLQWLKFAHLCPITVYRKRQTKELATVYHESMHAWHGRALFSSLASQIVQLSMAFSGLEQIHSNYVYKFRRFRREGQVNSRSIAFQEVCLFLSAATKRWQKMNFSVAVSRGVFELESIGFWSWFLLWYGRWSWTGILHLFNYIQ